MVQAIGYFAHASFDRYKILTAHSLEKHYDQRFSMTEVQENLFSEKSTSSMLENVLEDLLYVKRRMKGDKKSSKYHDADLDHEDNEMVFILFSIDSALKSISDCLKNARVEGRIR